MTYRIMIRHDMSDWVEVDGASEDNRFSDFYVAQAEILYLRLLGEPWASSVMQVQRVP